ncbi:MAG: 3-methyladenine DNA glycosylase, partial [Opitutaceae bacterium]
MSAPALLAEIETPPAIAVLRERLEPREWTRRQQSHLARARQWTGPHRERASHGEKHPVLDFLFNYYSRRASALERWHPGIDVALAGDAVAADGWLGSPCYVRNDAGGIIVDPQRLPRHRLDSVRGIASLLRACADRPPSFGCFGLHEWAMVYRAGNDGVRHEDTPLRFRPDELATIVEQLGVRCSHFDAFRFFTPAARPVNRLQPARDDRLALEQRGCVHVTMDLYKWAYKLEPFTPGELVLDTFELALAARDLDMRASPYDLRHLGYEPVKIETPEGRARYEQEQR